MPRPTGETASLMASINGEMSVSDIPLATWADLDAIKAGDDAPLEVVVEVPVGRSRRGWNYRAKALQSIVGEVMGQGLPGFLGHQKPENVDTEFPTPVTHWVGAKFDPQRENKDSTGKVLSKGVAYFRGVVDKSADDLKRWVKAKVIRQVSIFGYPKIQKAAGETNVVDYQALSIDWTPLNRMGMPTKIVALGEIDVIGGELDGSHEELHNELREVARQVMGITDGDNQWIYIEKVFDDAVIVEYTGPNKASKLYKFGYAVIDGKLQLGEKAEVVKKTTYEPTGEIYYGGSQSVDWKEYLAKIRAMIKSGDVTLGQVVGEMGWQAQQIAGEIDAEWLKKVTGEMALLGDIMKELGVEPDKAVAKVKELVKAAGEMAVIEQTRVVGEMLTDKVKSDAVRTALGDDKTMLGKLFKSSVKVQPDMTKEQIASEIDTFLADEAVKGEISRIHTDPVPVGSKINNRTDSDAPKALRKKSVAL